MKYSSLELIQSQKLKELLEMSIKQMNGKDNFQQIVDWAPLG